MSRLCKMRHGSLSVVDARRAKTPSAFGQILGFHGPHHTDQRRGEYDRYQGERKAV